MLRNVPKVRHQSFSFIFTPHMLPQQLIQSLQGLPGFDEQAFLQVHEQAASLTSVRLNPHKKLDMQQYASLHFAEPVAWCDNAFYLQERPSFTLDPLFHAGAYYVQEACSMFLHAAIKQLTKENDALKVLDLCAAPGGKSTLLQAALSPNSLLVCNEVIKTRVQVLKENMTKWGAANVVITNNDPKDFARLSGFFDVLVCDAPCSGSGLFRRDANAIEEWSENNVALCSQRQQRILADVLPALKKEGLLIYSTCSYSEAENEEICDWLMDNFALQNLPMKTQSEWQIVETESKQHQAKGYRFYPNRVKGEGFFMACFQKTSEAETGQKQKMKTQKQNADLQKMALPFLKNADAFEMVEANDNVYAFPRTHLDDIETLRTNLYVRKAGIELGEKMRDEILPSHELALSECMRMDWPAVDLSVEQALTFLRRQDLQLDGTKRGWVLMRQNGLNLGWAKVLPNRMNNYYPKEWRILKQ
jgi:16S rRNA C967 or C1407 C5-methylase (RsmB/RsmF family)/NOL1/NOP2/fmu family ribosome biogenesis protein